MRKPAHQAQFFRLLAEVLGYIVSGDNDVGFVSKSEWNTYWKSETAMNVPSFLLSFPLTVFSPFAHVDSAVLKLC